MVDEALPLIIVGQADKTDHRDAGSPTGRRGQQHGGVHRLTVATKQRVIDHRGSQVLRQALRVLVMGVESGHTIRQVGQQIREGAEAGTAAVGEVLQRGPEHGSADVRPACAAVDTGPNRQRGHGRIDRRVKLVLVVPYAREVGQRLEA